MKKIFTRSLVLMLVLSLLMGTLASINVSAYDVDAIPVEVGDETWLYSGETVWLSVTHEELYIEAEVDFSGYVGETLNYFAYFEPINSQWEMTYWTVDDPDIAYLEDYESSCTVVFLKEGTTTLRAYTDSGLSATVEIEGVEPPVMLLDEEKNVDVNINYGNAYFKFSPEVDGVYTFYSKGDMDADGSIYNSDLELIANNYEGGEKQNFQVTAELFAGESYILESILYAFKDESCPEYTVGITKASVAQGVVIECLDRTSGYFGEECSFSALFLPEFSHTEECIWTVEDETVAEVYYEDTECYVTFISEGKTTLTVTSESGFSDSVEIECLPVPTLKLDETVTVTTDGLGEVLHKFIPEEDGVYVFYAEGEYSTTAALMDSEMNYLASPSIPDMGDNFVIQYELYADEEYYLYSGITDHDDSIESYTYDITVSLATIAENVEIDDIYEGEVVVDKMPVGGVMGYIAAFSPVTALMEECIWTVDKEGIIEIQDLSMLGHSNICMVQAIGEGDVTVTVTTESGHTASITLTVYGEYLMGDVDGDGNVGGKDSNVLKQYLAGSIDSIHELNADMNMDGSVDAKDSNLLKQYIAGVFDFEM